MSSLFPHRYRRARFCPIFLKKGSSEGSISPQSIPRLGTISSCAPRKRTPREELIA